MQTIEPAPAEREERLASPAVVAEHLARRFGPQTVLADISFAVPTGESLGLVGVNGAGKTVLLRLLASLDRPTSGRARIGGLDTVLQARGVRRLIGYVPEEPRLYRGITAEQVLHFVGRARGLGPMVRAATVDSLLQVVGLTAQRHQDLGRLSPGERRRVALAMALVHEPPVLLLDDPLRGLDGYARLEQIEVLRELRNLGTTVVLAATRPEDALDACERLAVLRDGVIAWSGTVDDLARRARPAESGARYVRLEAIEGREAAVQLLAQHRAVRDLELDEDGQTLWFLFLDDLADLAGLVPQLTRAGVQVARFGQERRSDATALASLMRSEDA